MPSTNKVACSVVKIDRHSLGSCGLIVIVLDNGF